MKYKFILLLKMNINNYIKDNKLIIPTDKNIDWNKFTYYCCEYLTPITLTLLSDYINYNIFDDLLKCNPKIYNNLFKTKCYNLNKLNKLFLKKYYNDIEISCDTIISELDDDIIKLYIYKIDWQHVSKFEILNSNFIVKYDNQINFSLILEYQDLDQNILLKYLNQYNTTDFDLISRHQKLSKIIINKIAYNICWHCLSFNPNLTKDIIKTYSEYFNIEILRHNSSISSEDIDELCKSGIKFNKKIKYCRYIY